MTDCLDVSNYTSAITPAHAATLHAAGIELVIVQSLQRSRFPYTVTRQQLQTLAAAGIATDVYVYPFQSNGVGDALARLSETAGLEHLIGRVWLDAEDVEGSHSGPSRSEMVSRWLEPLDRWAAQHGKPPTGVYTAWWWCRDYLRVSRGTVLPWSDRDLWDANYDGVADPEVFYPYCGFTRAAIKQFAGTSTFLGVSGVDLNQLSAAELARVRGGHQPKQPGEEDPMPDPTVDYPWQDKRDAVVSTLGYIAGDLAGAVEAEASRVSSVTGRPLAPRKTVLRQLAQQIETTARSVL